MRLLQQQMAVLSIYFQTGRWISRCLKLQSLEWITLNLESWACSSMIDSESMTELDSHQCLSKTLPCFMGSRSTLACKLSTHSSRACLTFKEERAGSTVQYSLSPSTLLLQHLIWTSSYLDWLPLMARVDKLSFNLMCLMWVTLGHVMAKIIWSVRPQ